MSATTTKQPFAELLAGLQQNKLSLVDIIQALNARGPVQAPLHKAELAMLDDALAKKKLDDKLHRLLVGKLKEVQTPKAVVEKTAMTQQAYKPGNEDKTVAAGGGDKTTINPAAGPGGDKTVINPAGAGGDATVVNTAGNGGGDGFDLLMGESDSDATEMAGDEAATTGFKPSEPATKSKTGGTGPNTSTWQRVAQAGGVEREVHAGDTLKERFKLEKEVGRGGMGIVFKAIDERKVEAQDKNPWVAVKVLNPEFRKHPQALVALQRESRKAQQLTHDNILRVYDFDKDGTVIYMTMEYCDAGALKDWIKKNPNGMPWDKGWPVIAGLARGLGRAHRDNIVHSDFKPGNVMMTQDGTPKLFDMGIARAAKSGSESKGETTVFDAGELGALTPAYASLEMIQGQPPELVDDIYALGITAYEILTGKHPFNKKNAEQAMKEGMKPPVVPGISRAQNKALQRSVAFKRADRIQSCDQLLKELQPKTMKDYALPAAIGFIALIVLGIVINVVLGKLSDNRVNGMIQQFAQGQFADPTAAVAALEAMKPSEKETAMTKGSKDIQNFFFNVANSKWSVKTKSEQDPETKQNRTVWDKSVKDQKFDYPAALAAIEAAKTLYPDSASVATNSAKLTDEKATVISSLNEEFNDHVDNNRIYEDKSPNIVETVGVVRQIDPKNDLLSDKKLLGRYTTEVRNALETEQFEVASKRATTAVKVFPADTDLQKLQAAVKQGYEMKLAAAKQRELQEKMTAAEAKTELAKLAANPLFTPDWQVGVNVAMSKLTGDTTPETMQVKSSLAESYAKQLGGKLDQKDLIGGQQVADASMKLFPNVPSLMKEIGRLGEMKKIQQKEEAEKAAVAEADTLKRTLKTKADANDLKGAQLALDKLKAYLPANDPFLSGEGPKALAQAYLRQANRQAEQGRYDAAQQFAANGLKVMPNMQELRDAEKNFRIEGNAQYVQVAAASPQNAVADKVKTALEALRSDDANRASRVTSDAQSNVVSRLRSLGATDPSAANKGKAEWLKVFPGYEQLASLTFTSTTAAPAQQTQAQQTPSASTGGSTAAATRPSRPRGTETCSASYSTFGRSGKATCQDDVNGQPGPKLVVVPSPAGGVMAITKYEITNGQFNAFCGATGKCKAEGNESLPRANVSLGLAKAYAQWLTETTGFTYRLPTDGEWQNAANAGGAGAGEDFNCVLMQGGNQIKGGVAISVSTGKPNPWGLMNALGNVAEWTDSGSARGGHFNTPTSQCTVDWRQGGGDNDTVGLRLVREMG